MFCERKLPWHDSTASNACGPAAARVRPVPLLWQMVHYGTRDPQREVPQLLALKCRSSSTCGAMRRVVAATGGVQADQACRVWLPVWPYSYSLVGSAGVSG